MEIQPHFLWTRPPQPPLDGVSFEPAGPPCFDDVTISKGISTPFVDQAIFVALSFGELYVQKAKKHAGCLMVILLLNRSDTSSERKQNYCIQQKIIATGSHQGTKKSDGN